MQCSTASTTLLECYRLYKKIMTIVCYQINTRECCHISCYWIASINWDRFEHSCQWSFRSLLRHRGLSMLCQQCFENNIWWWVAYFCRDFCLRWFEQLLATGSWICVVIFVCWVFPRSENSRSTQRTCGFEFPYFADREHTASVNTSVPVLNLIHCRELVESGKPADECAFRCGLRKVDTWSLFTLRFLFS